MNRESGIHCNGKLTKSYACNYSPGYSSIKCVCSMKHKNKITRVILVTAYKILGAQYSIFATEVAFEKRQVSYYFDISYHIVSTRNTTEVTEHPMIGAN